MDSILIFLRAHLNDIIAIAAIYLVGQLFLYGVIRRFADKTGENSTGGRKHKRAQTVAKLLHGVGHAVLLLIILFWVLRIFNVDPTPILASAGVVGLAIGFGAQTLVKDFFSGLFILAENQYGLGDTVVINGSEGKVKNLTVRSTVLEDKDGNRIYIPNGSVSVVINKGEK
jgi:small-conductance mechanosensitive channel